MVKKKKTNEIIHNIQEDINSYSETTSSTLQKDVEACVLLNNTSLRNNSRCEVLAYRLETLEKKVEQLQSDITELNAPLIHKLNKYKTIYAVTSGVFALIISPLIYFAFSQYNKNIYEKIEHINEKSQINSLNIQDMSKRLEEVDKNVYLFKYTQDSNQYKNKL